MVALLRTADVIRRRLAQRIEPAGITLQQYNVLRILRGAGPAGLPTLAIRDRMIEAAPGVTRLIDRLEQAGLVRRDRSSKDRRMVRCQVTPAGLDLLRRLDPIVTQADDSAFDPLELAEQRELIRLLDAVRAAER